MRRARRDERRQLRGECHQAVGRPTYRTRDVHGSRCCRGSLRAGVCWGVVVVIGEAISERERASAAIEAAAECFDCGKALRAVWRVRVLLLNGGAPVVPLCAACVASRASHRSWSVPMPCLACGRPVHRECAAPGERVVCSRACDRAAVAAERRTGRMPGCCENCGAQLPPSRRRPWRYCPGGACKQRGYRRRRRKRKTPLRVVTATHPTPARCECPNPVVDHNDPDVTCWRCGKTLLGNVVNVQVAA